MNRMTRLSSIALLLGATILIAATQADAQRRPTRRPSGPQLKVGQDAPEIELSPLTFAKNDKGEMVGTIGTEKVKLSTYKGKAPVVVFSSSYT